MPSSAASPPICQALPSPDVVADEEAFVVPLSISEEQATQAAREAILGSVFRPYDIQGSAITAAVLAYVPFWRVHATVDGFHIGLDVARDEDGGIKWILPTGGARHRDAVLLVTARRHFPFEPMMTQVPGRLHFQNGALALRPFRIELEEMVPRASHPISSGEVVQPDVTRAQAEREAMDRILRAVQPASALYAKYEPKVRSAAFCQYPLYVVRYGYEGHAKRHAGEVFHVTVSGRSGKVVGSRHPSAVRALARKFRQLIG
jgi:hypothetical protein